MAYKRVSQLTETLVADPQAYLIVDKEYSSAANKISVTNFLANQLKDAPAGDSYYVRQAGTWIPINVADVNNVTVQAGAVEQFANTSALYSDTTVRSKNKIYVVLNTAGTGTTDTPNPAFYVYKEGAPSGEEFVLFRGDITDSINGFGLAASCVSSNGQIFFTNEQDITNLSATGSLSAAYKVASVRNIYTIVNGAFGTSDSAGYKANYLTVSGITKSSDRPLTIDDGENFDSILGKILYVFEELDSNSGYLPIATSGGYNGSVDVVAREDHTHPASEIIVESISGAPSAALNTLFSAGAGPQLKISKAIDAENGYQTVTCNKSGTVFNIVNPSNFKFISFTTPSIFNVGDSFTVNGSPATTKTQRGEDLGQKFFAQGYPVTCIYESDSNRLTFPAGGGSPYVASPNAPSDTTTIWINTANYNPYIYSGTSWIPLGAVWK